MNKKEKEQLAIILSAMQYGSSASRETFDAAERFFEVFPFLREETEFFNTLGLAEEIGRIITEKYMATKYGSDWTIKRSINTEATKTYAWRHNEPQKDTINEVVMLFREITGLDVVAIQKLLAFDELFSHPSWSIAKQNVAEDWGYDTSWLP